MILMGYSENSCSALSHAMIQRRFCVVSHLQVPEQLRSSQVRRLSCLSRIPLLIFHSPADLSVVPVVLRFACTLLAESLSVLNRGTPHSPHNHVVPLHIFLCPQLPVSSLMFVGTNKQIQNLMQLIHPNAAYVSRCQYNRKTSQYGFIKQKN